ncbi:pinin/SDK/memA/ protein conserved region-domain-containing protein [Thelonectria olida]|uniref:Pinin/SDK/memA/ protein conserved region-domain-containing protein n=1 Tax=Thelonectria olida TaxID=1576542 RepID=A0A9P9APV8_9HYPO|nr:pinin/SDK/memA/ protein conserved region-domain-containing protein [Thelonectria olida]
MDGAISNHDADVSYERIEPAGLKRRASRDEDNKDVPKRTRYDDDRTHADRRSRQDSPPSRRGSYGNGRSFDHDRGKVATQEEKKRGKRLFGGVLNTLSQTTGSSQQKRRREIEQRQRERMQKQKLEDESRRTEKLARLNEVRMSEQIVWEEEVMRHKHAKMLAMAKFLRTKAHPWIYYLPWKLTPAQEEEIQERVQNVKATIERDLEAFKGRKQWHRRDHGSHQTAQAATPEKPSAAASDVSTDKPARGANGSELPAKGPDKEHHGHHHHHHDESADVMEVADEDMVIY